jgi:putative endopeptidase
VRQQDRLFFIGYARAWRTRATDQAVREQIASDIHAPVKFRVATVRNMDAWYEAFNVEPGQRYYLEPAARIHIW